MNKQVNFTTVMDYRQTFTVDIDFEEIKKDLMANAGSDRSSQYLSVSITISISLIMVFSLGVVLYFDFVVMIDKSP